MAKTLTLIGSVLFAVNAVAAAESHLQQNLVFRELIEVGVTAGGKSRTLPKPTLPDGLSTAQQLAQIERLGGARYPFQKLARKSVVAPLIVRVPSVKFEGTNTPLRTVDVWFIVHAELDAVADSGFLAQLLNTQRRNGRAASLTAQQLQVRDISIAEANLEWEGFGHVKYDLLDKVRISATGRSFWTRSDESIVGAVKLDRRFLEDDEFPNQWKLLERAGKKSELGPTTPYDGVGFYVKITRLQRPAGALLVEYHLVFAEPVKWFRGTNQLGAKLPAVVQAHVRTARREMMTASRAP